MSTLRYLPYEVPDLPHKTFWCKNCHLVTYWGNFFKHPNCQLPIINIESHVHTNGNCCICGCVWGLWKILCELSLDLALEEQVYCSPRSSVNCCWSSKLFAQSGNPSYGQQLLNHHHCQCSTLFLMVVPHCPVFQLRLFLQAYIFFTMFDFI